MEDGSLPDRIGTYRVLSRIATGGTSDVLLARSEGPKATGRTVVLKLLLQEFREDEQFERMFAAEAAAYARLSHPAIVELYDFFSDAEQLVMVLEYVDGMPLHKLRALLKRGKYLDDAAALFVGWRVFGALAAAHAARDPETGALAPVIHRDVNPSNVLIPWDGQVKIADFGIAKVTGVDNDKTQAGFIKGTYGYMAPEQVRGEVVTDRADVYAASLLVWELLVGRKAIVRGGTSDMDVLRSMAEPAFPALGALRPELPLEVLDAIDRGLERDPKKRTITAEEIASALRISFALEEGTQRLIDAMTGVRPPAAPEDLAATVSRRPLPSIPDSAADMTIPNMVMPADATLEIPRAAPPSPAPARPAAPPRPAQTARISTSPALSGAAFGGASSRGVASTPLAKQATLMGIAPGRAPAVAAPPPPPARTPAPAPASASAFAPTAPAFAPPPSALAYAPPPQTVRTPPPPVTRSQPPQPIAAVPQQAPIPKTLVISSFPPPPSPIAQSVATPWVPPPPPVAFAPPAPPAPPPPFAAPVPPFAASTARPPPAPGQVGRIVTVAAAAGVITLALIVALWVHWGTPSAYVPPPHPSTSARPSATAAVTTSPTAASPPAPVASPTPSPSPTPAPSPAPSPPPATPSATVAVAPPAPTGTMGTITVPESRGGHRVWVDDHLVGESPGTFSVRCGWRAVQVGSQGQLHNVNVPCGDDVQVRW